jgi:hypothetical protein
MTLKFKDTLKKENQHNTFSIKTISIRTLSIKTLSIRTLSKMTLSIKTLSKMTFSIKTLSIKTRSTNILSIKAFRIMTFKHKDTQKKDSQHKGNRA